MRRIVFADDDDDDGGQTDNNRITDVGSLRKEVYTNDLED